jgi:predicted nucleotidyltransferase component of viral defense system
MNEFALAPAGERQSAFIETAARMGVRPLIIEKDFWVCWCLGRLFEMPDLPGHIFKGGTSLSKVYGLIHRFSEDIDISLNRAEMGFGKDNDPAAEDLSGKKRQKLRNELAGACATYIETEMLPRFQKACQSILGENG